MRAYSTDLQERVVKALEDGQSQAWGSLGEVEQCAELDSPLAKAGKWGRHAAETDGWLNW